MYMYHESLVGLFSVTQGPEIVPILYLLRQTYMYPSKMQSYLRA